MNEELRSTRRVARIAVLCCLLCRCVELCHAKSTDWRLVLMNGASLQIPSKMTTPSRWRKHSDLIRCEDRRCPSALRARCRHAVQVPAVLLIQSQRDVARKWPRRWEVPVVCAFRLRLRLRAAEPSRSQDSHMGLRHAGHFQGARHGQRRWRAVPELEPQRSSSHICCRTNSGSFRAVCIWIAITRCLACRPPEYLASYRRRAR